MPDIGGGPAFGAHRRAEQLRHPLLVEANKLGRGLTWRHFLWIPRSSQARFRSTCRKFAPICWARGAGGQHGSPADQGHDPDMASGRLLLFVHSSSFPHPGIISPTNMLVQQAQHTFEGREMKTE